MPSGETSVAENAAETEDRQKTMKEKMSEKS